MGIHENPCLDEARFCCRQLGCFTQLLQGWLTHHPTYQRIDNRSFKKCHAQLSNKPLTGRNQRAAAPRIIDNPANAENYAIWC